MNLKQKVSFYCCQTLYIYVPIQSVTAFIYQIIFRIQLNKMRKKKGNTAMNRGADVYSHVFCSHERCEAFALCLQTYSHRHNEIDYFASFLRSSITVWSLWSIVIFSLFWATFPKTVHATAANSQTNNVMHCKYATMTPSTFNGMIFLHHNSIELFEITRNSNKCIGICYAISILASIRCISP